MSRKQKIIVFGLLIVLLIMTSVGTVYLKRTASKEKVKKEQIKKIVTGKKCLGTNEFVDYPINERYAKEVQAPKNPLVISIRDTETQKEKFSFQIENL